MRVIRGGWRLAAVGTLGLLGCSQATESAGESDTSDDGAAGRRASLRASAIVAIQSDAGAAYALVRDEGGALRGRLPTIDSSVRHDELGTHLGPDEGAEDVSLRLAAMGCDGERRRVGASSPRPMHNRATFDLDDGTGRSIEAWYASGPLGLEQGFTVPRSWGCSKLELEIEVGRARVETPEAPSELVLVGPHRRYRVSDLFAHDAARRAVGARMRAPTTDRIVLEIDAQGATFPLTIDPLVAVEQTKLVAPDAAASDLFGYAVALSGDTALVGAYNADLPGQADAGAAYVFVRTGSTWTQQAKLVASDAAASDFFGRSVDLDGDTAIVGAYLDDHVSGFDAGSAYVFLRTGSTWSQQAKLVASDGAGSDYFGYGVAIDGDTAIVGARLADVGPSVDAGAAYVFSRSVATWSQQAKLTAGDAAAGDSFGVAVDVSGDTAVVGAPSDDVAALADAGSASVFARSGSVWTEQAKLLASDGAAGDELGIDVAIDGDTILVGAYLDDAPTRVDAGSVYSFVRSGNVWPQQAKLVASDIALSDNFGWSVALDGDLAVVGAFAADQPSAFSAGAAYLFSRATGAWVEQSRFGASDAEPIDLFGRSVDISGDTVLVGASLEDRPGLVDAGAVYAFLVRKGLGDPCTTGPECGSGFCVEGVCCSSACGGGDPSDCQACTAVNGASLDGTCTVLPSAVECRASAGDCDPAEACDGVSPSCPADALHSSAVVCRAAVDDCDLAEACTGASVDCPADALAADDTPCDDGNACSDGDRCVSGACTAQSGLDCDDANPCTANDCDVATGCLNTPLAAATPCDDGDACSTDDACDGAGVCEAGPPLACSDGEECTTDACDPQDGCVFAPVADGTACAEGTCEGGTCQEPGAGGASGAGGGGAGGEGVGGAGVGGEGVGGDDGGADGEPAGGCDCRSGPASHDGRARWLALVAVVSVVLRRRRR